MASFVAAHEELTAHPGHPYWDLERVVDTTRTSAMNRRGFGEAEDILTQVLPRLLDTAGPL